MNTEDIKAAVTPEMLMEQMLADAKKIVHVAELVSLNRAALALIVQDECPPKMKEHMSERAALGFVRIIFDVLSHFAHDLTEAVQSTESGEREARIVDVQILNEPTKH